MKTALVTKLKRQATAIIDELREDKKPVLITQHGAPAAYLVDVEDFENLHHRMSILEGIAMGESAIKAGRTKSQKEAKKRMARWLK